MTQEVSGNLSGLAHSEKKQLNKLFHRRIDKDEIVPLDFARELYHIAHRLRRTIGVLIDREGKIVEVFLGTKNLIYLPDLGRYRLGAGRLRRLRLIYSDLHDDSPSIKIPNDIYTDLEKLRLDMVVAVKQFKNFMPVSYAYLTLNREEGGRYAHTEYVKDLGSLDFDFSSFISELEAELTREDKLVSKSKEGGALLVGVYPKKEIDVEGSMDELKELARTAGVKILGTVIQRRDLDPKTLLGKGKLEEVVLECLRLGADHLIFDTELKPAQWRVITNSTELKVLDRSMLILDIFAQRASSSEGRLQVELAQLKYNLPKLVEKDAGLSRLTGGIGGRGPGETKLEIGRRRIRDRIIELEKRIDKISSQRGLRRQKRLDNKVPLICILGYTNVGKSTLFNALTESKVVAENKLFATLEPAQRRLDFLIDGKPRAIILSDTVGFIRNLPEELKNAFRATLEELEEASLFLHVLDISDPRIDERKAAVDKVLLEMGLANIPCCLILNKKDRVESETAQSICNEYNAIAVSASKRDGLSLVKLKIHDFIKGLGT